MNKVFVLLLLLITIFISGFSDKYYQCEITDEFDINEYKQKVTDSILEAGCINNKFQATQIAIIIFKAVYTSNFEQEIDMKIIYDDNEKLWIITTVEKNSKYLLIKSDDCEVIGIGVGNFDINDIKVEPDIINDDKVAAEISKFILMNIYGDDITNDLPLIVERYDETLQSWLVKTNLPTEHIGGNGYIILQQNCKIIGIWITQ